MNPTPLITEIYFLCSGAGSLILIAMTAMGAAHHGGHAGAAGHSGGNTGHIGGGSHGGAATHGGNAGHSGISHSGSPGGTHGHSAAQASHSGSTQHSTHHSGDRGGDSNQPGKFTAPTKTTVVAGGSDVAVQILMLLNPTTICAFIATFGSCGLITSSLFPFIPLPLTLPIAAAGGIFLTKLLLFFMSWITNKLFSSGTFTQDNLVGYSAEVTCSIENGRLGEICCNAGGPRYTVSARAAKPEMIFRRGALVSVCDFVDGIAIVEPWIDEITMTKLPTISTIMESGIPKSEKAE